MELRPCRGQLVAGFGFQRCVVHENRHPEVFCLSLLKESSLLHSELVQMSKQTTITTEPQLREAVRTHWASDAGLDWHWTEWEPRRERGIDALGELVLDKRRISFAVELKLNPGARDVEALAKRKGDQPLLLIAPSISDSLAQLCRERGLNCADLNGRLWLRVKGLLVERSAKRPRFRPVTAAPDVFSAKSSRLVRALLSHRDRAWTQTDLVEQTELSKGLVSRLVRHLVDEGLVAQVERTLKVTRWDALLDAWATRDEWRKRTTVQQFSLLVSEPGEVAGRLRDFLGDTPHAFTQWFAGWLRHPYTLPPVVTIYVNRFPDAAALEKKLLARRVEDGGRLWLVVPKDEGVLRETQTADGFTLAADVQIYLDLLGAGQRGDEQAVELRKWPDFAGGRTA